MRLVLGENADPQVAGIDEVGEHEIDQPIGTTEGNCGFGPVRGQRIQPLALTAGQDNAQHVWCFPHGYKLSAAANRCQGTALTHPPCGRIVAELKPDLSGSSHPPCGRIVAELKPDLSGSSHPPCGRIVAEL